MADRSKTTVARPNGFFGWFSKKRKPATSQAKTSDAANSTTAPQRKVYTPRYAARDMLMSTPIAERPNIDKVVADLELQSVCEDIGFAAPSPYSYRARADSNISQTRSTGAFPSSSRSLAPSRDGASTPRSELERPYFSHDRRGSKYSFQGFDAAGPSRGSRSLHESSSCRNLRFDEFDVVLGAAGLDSSRSSIHDAGSRSSSPVSWAAPNGTRNKMNYAQPRTVRTNQDSRPSYFSHASTPDLRLRPSLDKGKGRSTDSLPRLGSYGLHGESRTMAPSRLRTEQTLSTPDEDDEEDLYIIRTQRKPQDHQDRVGAASLGVPDNGTTESRHHSVPELPHLESSNVSFIESTISEANTAQTDYSKRAVSTISTAPTERSDSDATHADEPVAKLEILKRDSARPSPVA